MIITKQKKRTILSLTEKEYDELYTIIAIADSDCQGLPYHPNDKDNTKEAKWTITIMKKWCKAFGRVSYAFLEPEYL